VTAVLFGAPPPRRRRPGRPLLVVVAQAGRPTLLLPRGTATEAALIDLVEGAGVAWTPAGREGLSVAASAAGDVAAAAEVDDWAVKVVRK
jgi:hypothetical protein